MTRATVYAQKTFLLLALLVPAACSSFHAADEPGPLPAEQADAGDPKAPPITGTPDDDALTEDAGIFVSPSGSDNGDGSRARPLATIRTAITSATKVGKSVFACTGVYAEAVVIYDSISIIGGLDCADASRWRTGAAPSTIIAPTSPALTARAIAAPTRVEGLNIIAPAATSAGGSSVGVLADHSPGLTIAKSKIAAGNGANGENGENAIQLVETGRPTGGASPGIVNCGTPGACQDPVTHVPDNTPGALGGTSTCSGAPNHDGMRGGQGGNGGLWTVVQGAPNHWIRFQQQPRFAGNGAGEVLSGANGGAGKDGTSAAEFGTFTSDGYRPASGTKGDDGSPGSGGSGGTGGSVGEMPDATTVQVNSSWSGVGGAGGGAGGCPGLAGGAGAGGGASVGVALLDSPVVLEDVAITAATGGSGGLGSFGSLPTVGGEPGTNATLAAGAAKGGDGGFPGVSTNGANGPSIGILVSGPAPALKGTSKATPGRGAPPIDARTEDTRTIPATPAGLSADIKSL